MLNLSLIIVYLRAMCDKDYVTDSIFVFVVCVKFLSFKVYLDWRGASEGRFVSFSTYNPEHLTNRFMLRYYVK